MEKVLIVEDDPNLGSSLKNFLTTEGFDPTLSQSLAMAREDINKKPDIIILDWMLPDGQGIDFLKELRGQNNLTPIIMLTARVDLIDKVIGLESGANDYVTKPFEPRELVARVRAHLRTGGQNEEADKSVLKIKNVEIDFIQRKVFFDGNDIDMTKMEFDLLKLLAESPNKVFSREEILNKVWGYEHYPTTRTVDTHILQLRNKLTSLEIETVRGVGYRLKL